MTLIEESWCKVLLRCQKGHRRSKIRVPPGNTGFRHNPYIYSTRSRDSPIFGPQTQEICCGLGKGYGTIDIMVTVSENNRKRTSKKILPIRDVAYYCQDFTTNQVSLSQLHKRGMWWDNRPGYNHLRRVDFSIGFVAVLEKH